MRELLAIRQTKTDAEYAERFEQAKHKVLVHNPNIDDVFFVQKFLDRLRYNISNVITLLDGALSLALMQEDLLEASSKRYHSRSPQEAGKFSPRSLPTSSPGVLGSTPTEQTPASTPSATQKPKWEDKLTTLRA